MQTAHVLSQIEKYNNVSFFTNVVDNLTAELDAIGVKFYYIKLSKKICDEGPPFEYEYFREDVIWKLPRDTSYMYVSERSILLASATQNGKISIHHHITPELINAVNTILFKYFPNRTLGCENESCPIDIYISQQDKLVPQSPILRMCVTLYYPRKEHYSEEEIKKMIDVRICLAFSDDKRKFQKLYLEVPHNLIKELVANMRAIVNTNNTITHFEIVDFENEMVLLDLSQYE